MVNEGVVHVIGHALEYIGASVADSDGDGTERSAAAARDDCIYTDHCIK